MLMIQPLTFCRIISMLLTALLSVNAYAVDIVKLQVQQMSENKAAHNTEVLQRALEVTEPEFGAFKLEIVNITMNSSRILQSLIDGKIINVALGPEREWWEKHIISIKVPVRLGLLSYRLLLINKKDQAKFTNVKTLEQLKSLPVGLHKGWMTTKVFKESQFNVIEAGHFDSLFLMLNKSRFDYIPRGIYEAYDDLAARQDTLKELIVEPTMALYMPTLSYMNVSPTEPRLAKRIESGLLKLQSSGELKALLYKYYGKGIEQAGLKNRKIFNIDNPNVNPGDKLKYETLLTDFNA